MRAFILPTLIISMFIGSMFLQAQNDGILPGDGLNGHYYNGYSVDSTGVIVFDGLTESFARVDSVIDFWDGSKGHSWRPLPETHFNFSIHWNGYIYIEESGEYGFGTISDDGSQVFIDNTLIVDNSEKQWFDWEDNMAEGDSSNTPFTPLVLDAGFHDISISFYEDVTYEGIEFWWLKPGLGASDIPYYGDNFGSIDPDPTYNPDTTWEIVPKSVLYTSLDKATSIDDINHHDNLPAPVKLLQNYPNPFNPKTVISYNVRTNGPSTVHVELSIYSILGQRISTLVSEPHSDGIYTVKWDGAQYSGGIYFCVLTSDNVSFQTRKLMLMK